MKHPLDLHPRHRRRTAYPRSRPASFRPRRASGSRGGLLTLLLAGLFAGVLWTRMPDGAVIDRIVPPALLGEPDVAVGRDGVGAGVRASFSVCHTGGGTNCVVDGDTFWMEGEKIRIADIDTPETHPARCAREAELGAAATHRLRELLNSGRVMLTAIDRDTDRYGRKLRIAEVDGVGVGETLVAEGLARRYEGGRRAGGAMKAPVAGHLRADDIFFLIVQGAPAAELQAWRAQASTITRTATGAAWRRARPDYPAVMRPSGSSGRRRQPGWISPARHPR